jgi:hypothetical protein
MPYNPLGLIPNVGRSQLTLCRGRHGIQESRLKESGAQLLPLYAFLRAHEVSRRVLRLYIEMLSQQHGIYQLLKMGGSCHL